MWNCKRGSVALALQSVARTEMNTSRLPRIVFLPLSFSFFRSFRAIFIFHDFPSDEIIFSFFIRESADFLDDSCQLFAVCNEPERIR